MALVCYFCSQLQHFWHNREALITLGDIVVCKRYGVALLKRLPVATVSEQKESSLLTDVAKGASSHDSGRKSEKWMDTAHESEHFTRL